MPHQHIELEVRGEVNTREIPAIVKRLQALGFASEPVTRRTSVMSFGHVINDKRFHATEDDHADVRCRVTNGEAEIVAKIGPPHAHNRREIAIPLAVREMIGIAQLFGAMGFSSKIGSRIGNNFTKADVCVTIAQSNSDLAYIELEIISDAEHETRDLQRLRDLGEQLGVTLWKGRQEFDEFCKRLTERDDWEFGGTDKDIKRLKDEIRETGSDRTRAANKGAQCRARCRRKEAKA